MNNDSDKKMNNKQFKYKVYINHKDGEQLDIIVQSFHMDSITIESFNRTIFNGKIFNEKLKTSL